jgi:hypothetical protein
MKHEIVAEPEVDQLAGQWVKPNGNTASAKPSGPPPPPRVLDVDAILALKVTAPKMAIEKMLPIPGAVLLVGTHKSGKTVLAAQTAIAIASGHALFDNYRVLEPGPVLVIEQDDPSGAASFQDYLKASAVPVAGIPFHLVERVPFYFGHEFTNWLRAQITRLGLRLVVLDSYTALRASRSGSIDIVKAEQYDITELDSLAKDLNCTILVITHDSKGSFGMHWSDRTAGTFAMGAAAEGQIHVSRFPDFASNAPERLICLRGRHCDGAELVVRFCKATLNYEMVLEGGAAPLYPVVTEIHGALGMNTFSPKELCHAMGYAIRTAHNHIGKLYRAGALTRHGMGEYSLEKGIRL